MLQVAPIRCFLNDIPNVIAQHFHQQQQQQQQQAKRQQQHSEQCLNVAQDMEVSCSNTVTSNSAMLLLDSKNHTNSNSIASIGNDSHLCRKRRKIERTISTLWLRLLGTVVNVSTITIDGMKDHEEVKESKMSDENCDEYHTNALDVVEQQQQGQHAYSSTMTMDDGSGTIIIIHVTAAMIHKIHLQMGMIIDCIVRVVLDEEPHDLLRGSSTYHTYSTSNNNNSQSSPPTLSSTVSLDSSNIISLHHQNNNITMNNDSKLPPHP